MKRSVLPVFFGAVLGLSLLWMFNRFFEPGKGVESRSQDSLLSSLAVAGELTTELHQQRANSITNAVSRVSGAVVGINVIQVRRYVSRSPFSHERGDRRVAECALGGHRRT